MAAPRIKVDETKLRRKMQQYERIVGKEVRQLVHNSARLCCVQLAKFTQPYGNKSDAKKSGEKAITKDVQGGKRSTGKGKGRRGIFLPLTPFMKANAEFYGGSENIRLFVKKDGTVYGTDRAHFLVNASVGTLRAIHKTKFVNGRMSAAGGDTRDVGRWKFIDQYFASQNVINAFLKVQFRKVGLVKAGWAVAAAACRADVRQPLSGIPAWVRRNISKARGAIDDSKASGLGWKIKLKNQVGYARQTLSRTNENIAVQVSRQRMLSMMNHAIRYVKAKEAGLR
jgi:hypothetical protein